MPKPKREDFDDDAAFKEFLDGDLTVPPELDTDLLNEDGTQKTPEQLAAEQKIKDDQLAADELAASNQLVDVDENGNPIDGDLFLEDDDPDLDPDLAKEPTELEKAHEENKILELRLFALEQAAKKPVAEVKEPEIDKTKPIGVEDILKILDYREAKKTQEQNGYVDEYKNTALTMLVKSDIPKAEHADFVKFMFENPQYDQAVHGSATIDAELNFYKAKADWSVVDKRKVPGKHARPAKGALDHALPAKTKIKEGKRIKVDPEARRFMDVMGISDKDARDILSKPSTIHGPGGAFV